MAYITPDDVVLRYDRRRVAELLTTNDASPVDPDDLSGNASLLELCEDASSEIDSAVTVGNRYSRDDLTTLAASASEGAMLRRLACDLVWGNLLIFKGLGDANVNAQAPRYLEAKETLKRLNNGDLVFGLDANRDAGLPKTVIPNASSTNAPTYWNKLFGHFGNNNVPGSC